MGVVMHVCVMRVFARALLCVVCECSVEGKRLYLLHIIMMMMMYCETRSLWVRWVRWLGCDGLAAAAADVSTCVCGGVHWREVWRYRSVDSGHVQCMCGVAG